MLHFRFETATFIGAVLALAAIVATIAIYYLQRQRKRMLVETIATVPLVRGGGGAIEGLEIKFKDVLLDSATISIFRVSNIGNAPIPAADYENPVRVLFDEPAKILSANVVASTPKGIPAQITYDSNSATISPHLLNPGDSVTYRILLTGASTSLSATGRIAGVKSIERQRPTSLTKPILTIVGAIAVVSGYFMSPNPHSDSLKNIRAEEVPYIIVMTIGMIIFVAASTGELKEKIQAIMRKKLFNA